jgi:hypothetical protein
VSHRRRVSLNTIASGEVQTKPAGAATIFIHDGAPQALLGSYEPLLWICRPGPCLEDP